MRIFTWRSEDEYLPKALRAQARIMLNDGSWHPVLIHGDTESEAAETARKWWATALEKAAKKTAPKKKQAPAPVADVDDPGDVI